MRKSWQKNICAKITQILHTQYGHFVGTLVKIIVNDPPLIQLYHAYQFTVVPFKPFYEL